MAVFFPAVDPVDSFNLTYKYAPLIIISLHLALGIFSFTLDTWSTSRGDTAQILGCGAGVACGCHVNYMLGLMPDPPAEALPLLVPPLTATLFGKAIVRLLIGVVLLLLTKTAMKKVTIPLACQIFHIPCGDVRQARQRMEVELPYRYCTYGMVGFSLIFLIPSLFCTIGLSWYRRLLLSVRWTVNTWEQRCTVSEMQRCALGTVAFKVICGGQRKFKSWVWNLSVGSMRSSVGSMRNAMSRFTVVTKCKLYVCVLCINTVAASTINVPIN